MFHYDYKTENTCSQLMRKSYPAFSADADRLPVQISWPVQSGPPMKPNSRHPKMGGKNHGGPI